MKRLSKKQVEIATEVLNKNESHNPTDSIKYFILNKCICLGCCHKASLIDKTDDQNAKEFLDELVFDFQAPWLYLSCCYITKADYAIFENPPFLQSSFINSAKIVKEILDDAVESYRLLSDLDL